LLIQIFCLLQEAEARYTALKKESLLQSRQIIPLCEEPQQHINLFEDVEQGKVVSNATNAEYEKRIGYLTYLGQDTVEATGCVSWYNKVIHLSNTITSYLCLLACMMFSLYLLRHTCNCTSKVNTNNSYIWRYMYFCVFQ
jgi:hypothetical protein